MEIHSVGNLNRNLNGLILEWMHEATLTYKSNMLYSGWSVIGQDNNTLITNGIKPISNADGTVIKGRKDATSLE